MVCYFYGGKRIGVQGWHGCIRLMSRLFIVCNIFIHQCCLCNFDLLLGYVLMMVGGVALMYAFPAG